MDDNYRSEFINTESKTLLKFSNHSYNKEQLHDFHQAMVLKHKLLATPQQLGNESVF